jgi:hypothetical protein
MSKLLFFTCFVFCLLSLSATSQTHEEELEDTAQIKTFLTNHLVGGFNIGAKVGGNSYLYFSPFIGLQSKRFMYGGGVSFSQYIQDKPYIKEERFGVRLLAKYKLYKIFFASAEYEGMKHLVAGESGYEKLWTNSFMVGGGIMIPITEESKLTFELLSIIDYEPGKSPYGHRQSIGRLGLIF